MMTQTVLNAIPAASADLCDLFAERAAIIDLPWRQFGGKTSFCGPAATFLAADDTVLIRQMLEEHGAGRVLVIDNRASSGHAVFGDRFGALAVGNGWAGVVINGAIRDAEGLNVMDVGVFALGTCPRKPHKDGAGAKNVRLEMGGVSIAPGDWVTADADGVVVVSADDLTSSGS